MVRAGNGVSSQYAAMLHHRSISGQFRLLRPNTVDQPAYIKDQPDNGEPLSDIENVNNCWTKVGAKGQEVDAYAAAKHHDQSDEHKPTDNGVSTLKTPLFRERIPVVHWHDVPYKKTERLRNSRSDSSRTTWSLRIHSQNLYKASCYAGSTWHDKICNSVAASQVVHDNFCSMSD